MFTQACLYEKLWVNTVNLLDRPSSQKGCNSYLLNNSGSAPETMRGAGRTVRYGFTDDSCGGRGGGGERVLVMLEHDQENWIFTNQYLKELQILLGELVALETVSTPSGHMVFIQPRTSVDATRDDAIFFSALRARWKQNQLELVFVKHYTPNWLTLLD